MKVRGCVQGMKVRGLCAGDEGQGAEAILAAYVVKTELCHHPIL